MRTIDKSQLKDIATGATFIGSAGGGSLKPGLKMIDENMPDDGEVTIITVDEAMAADELTIAAEYYGSPFKGVDVSSMGGLRHAVERFRELAGGQVGQLIPIECGVQSTFVPVPLVAYQLQMRVVDADGAGRAVPGLTNYTSFADLPIETCVLANVAATESLTFRGVRDPAKLDELMSAAVDSDSFSGIGGIAVHALDGATLGEVTPIRGSFLLTEEIGRTLRTAPDPVPALFDVLRGHGLEALEIGRGEIVECVPVGRPIVSEGSRYVPPHGSVTVRDSTTGREVVLIHQSENLIAWDPGKDRPLAMAPDNICYVTPDGETFTNTAPAADRLGKEVVLVGIEARPAIRDNPRIMASFRDALRSITGYAGLNVPICELS